MGLLDFLDTPQGQALASGVATYAATARRGTPINNIGRGALGAFTGYGDAVKNQELQTQTQINNQFRMQQRMAIQRRMDMQQQRDASKFDSYAAMFDALDPSKQVQTAQPAQANPGAMTQQQYPTSKLQPLTNPSPQSGIPPHAIPISYDSGDGEDMSGGMGMDEDGNFTQQGNSGDRPSRLGEMQYTAPTMPVSMGAYTKARDMMAQAKASNNPEMAKQAITMLGGKFQAVPKLSQRLTDAIWSAGYNPADYQSLDADVRKQIVSSTMRAGPKPTGDLANFQVLKQEGMIPPDTDYTAWHRENAKAGAASMNNYGTPMPAINTATGEPVFMQPSKSGGTPSIIKGYAPPKQSEAQAGANSKAETALASLQMLDDRVTSLIKHPGLPKITGLMGVLPNAPGSQASDAQALLDGIKANAAIQAMNDMRAASKTGGAVGQVTEAEWPKLENSAALLAKTQGTPTFAASLSQFQTQIRSSKSRIEKAQNAGQYGYGNPTASEKPSTNPPTQTYSITAPNGKTYNFPDAASMQKAKKAMGL
jgi:hypothetical protein